jgi:transketolase
MTDAARISALRNVATQLRLDSIRSTTASASGHPTSCCSAAEIVATLFFSELRFDPREPANPDSDRFVLSKGHAAPILYSAWAHAGAFDPAELLRLRRIGSDLEGHPTPRLPFVDVATGSLGQGICAAVGTALYARLIGSDYRTYVLLGDGESAEGSVWEAATVAEFQKLDSLTVIVDVNALGQSQATQLGHDTGEIAGRWRAFGWHAIVVDGHDVSALLAAYEEARGAKDRPTAIVARTVKGRGISFAEGKDGWHGKPLTTDQMTRAVAELEAGLVPGPGAPIGLAAGLRIRRPTPLGRRLRPSGPPAPPTYRVGDSVATREAYGAALSKLADVDPRVVALDADVKNSTYSEALQKTHADRFYQNFIAEQVMIGAAMGLAARGAIPFPSTFACFLTRAYDFIRMAAISNLNVKLAGSHAGVSIGEDGPSQMGLEDIAMMRAQPNVTVLYPCDGVSAERLVVASVEHQGPVYIRTSRPKTPVIYDANERFEIGGSKVLRESPDDAAVVVAAGVTVFEALKAYEELKASGISVRVIDAYSVQPIDGATLARAGRQVGHHIITVEDHYVAGGLGDAVASAVAADGITVHRLAVREIPRSGKPAELLERFGISASHIATAVKSLVRPAAVR